ncbi:hypothetical protein [Puniceicoccus vermicola]|uniref:TIGR03790 family protein n=1 Tax=Puniceicoccus vermicola TaxID=388746 RepID=A0A7X1E4Q5_9BACT|nr:hypothetical protein [Puniceicoccus vermicola]MBC2600862.1 hypothetical protein [Puniceicoccus vermicola]
MPHVRFIVLAAVLFCFGRGLLALDPEQVLVVYNSQNGDSQEVADYYAEARKGVKKLDLNDESLLPGTISYADFISKIRTPIRTYLNGNVDENGDGLAELICVIVLTKGLPHRIQQIAPNSPNLGDNPEASSTAYNNGNITYASVDSELTLLQFDLEEGEAGGSSDSPADRAIYNPYYRGTTPFGNFDRSEIVSGDRYFEPEAVGYNWWLGMIQSSNPGQPQYVPFDAGHLYLTARLDAETVSDVKAMIDRAASVVIRKQTDAILLDADSRTVDSEGKDVRLQYIYDPVIDDLVDDYGNVESLFAADWDQLQFDHSNKFFRGAIDTISFSGTEVVVTGPVAHLNSYGVNHNGGGERKYLSSYEGQLIPGASFAAYESYGAAGLAGVTLAVNQAQVTEWIAAGGTFATGPVWEPFNIGISRSEVFLNAFYEEGLTYVEAAWSSIMQLSWQSVVIGDPLATATIIDAEPYYLWAFENTGTTPTVSEEIAEGADYDGDQVGNGVEYGFDLDPTAYSARPIAAPSLTAGGNAEFVIEIPDTAPSGATYSLEKSLTLAADSWSVIGSWSESGGASGSANVVAMSSGNGTTITITDAESIDPGEKAFYRLSVGF